MTEYVTAYPKGWRRWWPPARRRARAVTRLLNFYMARAGWIDRMEAEARRIVRDGR